jgi:hypothetical protein
MDIVATLFVELLGYEARAVSAPRHGRGIVGDRGFDLRKMSIKWFGEFKTGLNKGFCSSKPFMKSFFEEKARPESR